MKPLLCNKSWNKLHRNFFLTLVGVFLAASVTAQETKDSSGLFISPDHVQIQVGQEVSFRIEVRSASELFGAPFYLNYDQHLLKAIKVSDGGFLKSPGKQAVFIHAVDAGGGRIIVGITRLGKEAGANGDGTLANITFKALRQGVVTLSFGKVDFRDSHQASIAVRTHSATIEIR